MTKGTFTHCHIFLDQPTHRSLSAANPLWMICITETTFPANATFHFGLFKTQFRFQWEGGLLCWRCSSQPEMIFTKHFISVMWLDCIHWELMEWWKVDILYQNAKEIYILIKVNKGIIFLSNNMHSVIMHNKTRKVCKDSKGQFWPHLTAYITSLQRFLISISMQRCSSTVIVTVHNLIIHF